jgi:hypothetical protein
VFVNIAKKYVYTDFVKKNRWEINLIYKTMEIIARLFKKIYNFTKKKNV